MSDKAKSVIPDDFTLDNVPAILKDIKAKIKALVGDSDKSKKTEGLQLYVHEFDTTVENIKKPNRLIGAFAHVSSLEANYIQAAKDMGLKKSDIPAFTIGGKSANAWRDDLKSRFTAIVQADELAKLNKAADILQANLSKSETVKNQLAELLG